MKRAGSLRGGCGVHTARDDPGSGKVKSARRPGGGDPGISGEEVDRRAGARYLRAPGPFPGPHRREHPDAADSADEGDAWRRWGRSATRRALAARRRARARSSRCAGGVSLQVFTGCEGEAADFLVVAEIEIEEGVDLVRSVHGPVDAKEGLVAVGGGGEIADCNGAGGDRRDAGVGRRRGRCGVRVRGEDRWRRRNPRFEAVEFRGGSGGSSAMVGASVVWGALSSCP